MSVVSPAVSWWASDRVSMGLRYAHTTGAIDHAPRNVHGNTVHALGAFRIQSRFWLTAGYARGIDDFETVTLNEIGNFEANTVLGGFRFELPTLTSVVGSYNYQWRPDEVRVSRFILGLAQRF